MGELLFSGKASFSIDVPYKLLEVGNDGHKPLMVYLHGFSQNISIFQKQVSSLLSLEAYHLFVQAPYPVYDRSREKKVDDWGRAWYLYDGNQSQFVHSLERSSVFLQHILDTVLQQVTPSRTAVVGYSMGGYLAGYFGLSRYQYLEDLVVIGSRIKTEVFEDPEGAYDHLNVLALHGSKDRSVKSAPQKKSCGMLSKWGANVTFRELEAAHRLSDSYLTEAKDWFIGLGYQ
ncbi:alpha/beta hydrolase [Fodinibius salsisoli]|uniref:Phospholipase/carboxylesterase/thioesterase domain-containing protein n=1 Tax=Fodinibius salsisoli TaxID=2820877 RepID=A0ABT3PNJ0_9BACT|nr:hypothetical protein [Fodinibius salsisoli]MCW9707419.1 hypothetical protein [Fodinibius salsisoli]